MDAVNFQRNPERIVKNRVVFFLFKFTNHTESFSSA